MALLFFIFTAFKSDDGLQIVIRKGKVTINKSQVVPNWSLSGFKKVLGEPERERTGYNNTHTYDKNSIVLFEPAKEKVGGGIVSEFQIHFKVTEANDVTPTGDGFQGNLSVDNLIITEVLTAEGMLSKLKKWKKTDSYMEHSYRMASKGLYIYFQFNDDENRLLKVSIGPDKSSK